MAEQVKIGDVVQLKSGGPRMTIVHVPDDGKYIKCLWHTDNGAVAEYVFPSEALVAAD